ncbi:glycosyltransferase family 2 protein [Bacillus cereus]|uniref:glycosyltransferase family 2 protein n=1 Tax=Bacillus cereus TaxID=1396 RepID=UPI00178C28F4|nr:glycosyltransferase family 2 protein [Bacillus cereus]
MQNYIPKVSVIIPFYNQLDWVAEAVDSVLNQTFKDYEIILVDDGSSEDIKNSKIDINNPRINYIRKENSGPGPSRNRGIAAARGEFIAFLDSDDLFEESKLEKQIKFMEENNVSFCHTSYQTFDESGNEKFKDTSWFVGDVFKICFVSLPLATPTIMVRREILENPQKRFAEHMRFGQDGYLWIQLAQDYKLSCIPEALSKVRIRGDNTSVKVRRQLQAKAQLYDFMTENAKVFYEIKGIPLGVRFLYRCCKITHKLVENVTKVFKIPPAMAENLSRAIYLPLWVGFKLYKKKLV